MKKGRAMKPRNLIAIVVGGLVAFIWSSISWMAIPWHQPTMRVFQNETHVGRTIKEAAPTPGIYTYPGWTDDDADMRNKHDEGPYVFASVVPAGVGSEMSGMMLGGLLISMVGAAFLMTLMQLSPRATSLRVGVVAALFIGVVPALMNWNWWHFPIGFTVVGAVDCFISWTLAVLVMRKIAAGGGRPT